MVSFVLALLAATPLSVLATTHAGESASSSVAAGYDEASYKTKSAEEGYGWQEEGYESSAAWQGEGHESSAAAYEADSSAEAANAWDQETVTATDYVTVTLHETYVLLSPPPAPSP